MKRGVGALLGFIAVAAGLTAIFRVVVDTEVAIGFVTISFGVLAIIWTSMAMTSLSKGSSLRRHTGNFMLCLVFILLFTVWHTLSKLLRWRETINEIMLFPGYLFLILAFLIFVATSYQILTMGKEFGFKTQAKEISRVIESKKKRKTRKFHKSLKM
ncbi:MAG: hypothetical protein KKC75_08785 [Nanoarchaeota archaeon]|nr:hypothetical protein [Nanoarchaeota archaeon]MBU1004964.1 hypothetical protein [Nanoarchaeota archaeon]MBU1946396.1 hypothetical protein [Nanoarchaeota archaeon]